VDLLEERAHVMIEAKKLHSCLSAAGDPGLLLGTESKSGSLRTREVGGVVLS
jgi:hypothetical protein